jgi:putative ABC transport system permease protein
MTLAVRTATDPKSLLRPIVGQVREMDANLPVYNVKTMEEYLSDAMASTRFTMILIAIFAGVALVLASVGLYGVISYSVRQRTQEIGIRMAFGAERSDILRLVVGRGMLLIMIGVGLGLAGALGLTRVLASLLYGVAATDPVTYVGISGLLVAIALLACLVPAQRATRVDPMNSLRAE